MMSAADTPRGNALDRGVSPLQALRDALPQLGEASRRVAEIVLADPTAAASLSITTLSKLARSTPSTVTRLAALLGYDGYPAFRAAIATENGRAAEAGWERDIGIEIAMNDPAELVLGVLAGKQAQALRNTVSNLDTAAVSEVADLISRAGRVHIFGSWGDAIPARELHMRLMRLGVAAWFHESAGSAVVSARLMTDGDVAVVLSRTGDDVAATEFLKVARAAGAHAVALTGAPRAAVAQAAAKVIFTGTQAGEHWTDYFAGRASDSLATSLLWVLVAQKIPGAIAAHDPSQPDPQNEVIPDRPGPDGRNRRQRATSK